MKRSSIRRILYCILTLTVFCAFAGAATGGRVPQFTVQTLDGETVTNASLGGRVVLLQLWATWCPYCRRDQSAVDSIQRNFASQGLDVLALDVGEAETTVRIYLGEHPRSCRVALDQDEKLSARFGKHGYPFYVLIDRKGNIAGTQNGAGGEDSLLRLLSRVGMSMHSDTQGGGNRRPVSSSGDGKAKVIEVPRSQGTMPPKPSSKAVFVLANGERLEADQYTLDAGLLQVVVGGEHRRIAFGALDIKATVAANQERGIDLKIPQSRSEVFVAF